MLDLQTASILWMTLCSVLLTLILPGMCCLQCSHTPGQRFPETLSTHIISFVTGSLCFFLAGYGMIYGESYRGIIGLDFFGYGDGNDVGGPHFIYQLLLCAFLLTLFSIATPALGIVERIISTVFIAVIIYPFAAHALWNSDGMLARHGAYDYAGAMTVHISAGWIILAACLIRPVSVDAGAPEITGDSARFPLAAIGGFLIWIGWFGYYGGSAFSIGPETTAIIANTMLSAMSGAATAFVMQFIPKIPRGPTVPIYGAIAGLVSLAAGANVVSATGALSLGAIGAGAALASWQFLARTRAAQGASIIALHLVPAFISTVTLPLFIRPDALAALGGFNHLSNAQTLALLVVSSGVFCVSLLFFGITKSIANIVTKWQSRTPAPPITPTKATDLSARPDKNSETNNELQQLTELYSMAVTAVGRRYNQWQEALDNIADSNQELRDGADALRRLLDCQMTQIREQSVDDAVMRPADTTMRHPDAEYNTTEQGTKQQPSAAAKARPKRPARQSQRVNAAQSQTSPMMDRLGQPEHAPDNVTFLTSAGRHRQEANKTHARKLRSPACRDAADQPFKTAARQELDSAAKKHGGGDYTDYNAPPRTGSTDTPDRSRNTANTPAKARTGATDSMTDELARPKSIGGEDGKARLAQDNDKRSNPRTQDNAPSPRADPPHRAGSARSKGRQSTRENGDVTTDIAAKYPNIINPKLERARAGLEQILRITHHPRIAETTFNLNDEILATAQKLERRLSASKLNIEIEDAELMLKADLTFMRTMLENLILTSIKRSLRSDIHISAMTKDGCHHIAISDDGRAWREQEIEILRTPLPNGHPERISVLNKYGTGLGIVSAIIALHGGKLDIDSNADGKGATITISFPRQRCSTRATQRAQNLASDLG